jgi:predicted Zn-dependent protease
MMTVRPLSKQCPRGAAFRNAVLAMAVIGAVGVAGAGGYMYYRNNSPSHLAQRAQLALEQHDPVRAVDYLQRAVKKEPEGDTGMGLRLLMARAMLEQQREGEAKEYLYENIKAHPDRPEALDLFARTYVNPVYDSLRKRPKPLSAADAAETCAAIDSALLAFEGPGGSQAAHADAKRFEKAYGDGANKLPDTARNRVARAELHRLYYAIARDQEKQALAQRDAAALANDAPNMKEAGERIARAQQGIKAHRAPSLENLEQALKLEPTHPTAASNLAQYLREDAQENPELYARCVALYEQQTAAVKRAVAELKPGQPVPSVPEEVALNAARALQDNVNGAPDRNARAAAALKLLDGYVADHPDSVRALVLKGDILLDQKKIKEATELAEKLDRDGHQELFARILLVNCRLAEHNTKEALALLGPLTTSYDNRPEVWYFLGLAQTDSGSLTDAENAFRKALALSPGFTDARKALLDIEERKGTPEAAAVTAAQVLREDRFDYRALKITVEAMNKKGQSDRAQQMLLALAADPQLPTDQCANLARLLALNGKPADARKLLARLPENDTGTFNLRALIAAASGNPVEARALMARAVAADPDDVDLRLRYAELLAQNDLAADFRAQLEAIVASKKNLTAQQTMAVARNFLRVRLPARAIELLKPLLDNQPPLPEAQALAQDAQNMLAGASVGQASAALDVQHATMADLLRQAAALLREKKFDEALTTANTAIAKDKAVSAAHQLAALAHAGRNETAQAIDEAVTATALDANNPEPYRTFVSLFPTADAARKGLASGSRFETINPALGYWAMGQLAERSEQPEAALGFYTVGLEATSRLTDPRSARDVLYRSLQTQNAQRKDAAAIRKTADNFAIMEGGFSPTARLVAAEKLQAVGDRAAAGQQLDSLGARFGPLTPPSIVLMVATAWLDLEQPDKALALVDKQVNATQNEPVPELLDGYARLQARTGDLDKALETRQKLCAVSPADPKLRIALAEAQAATGDVPAARQTLKDAEALGDAGRQFAETARLRLDVSMGLLYHVGEKLKETSAAARPDDFASMLSVAQAWAQLKKFDEARKMAATIPSYAVEYPTAQVLMAAIDTDKGDYAAAIKTLNALAGHDAQGAAVAAPQLLITHLRAGDAKAALDLATRQRADYADNTPQARYWTTLAATAAREGRQFDAAVTLLNTLDGESRRAASLDIALMQLLQGKPADAAIAALADDSPAFNRTTFALLAGKTPDKDNSAKLIEGGLPSSALAALGSMTPDKIPAALAQLEKNPNLFADDIRTLVADLGANPGAQLRTIALAQRLLEAGWSTTALDVLAEVEKAHPSLAYVAVQRHQAFTDLRRTKDATAVRDALAARVAADPSRVPPSARVLLAASWAQEERLQDAVNVLQPLTALNRPELLTTMASLQEKLGKLDEAVKLHRQVLAIDKGNIEAANNLAYTLAAAHPNDPAALKEAREAVESAISKAPRVTAFQDTLGWIQILSGQAAEGTKRIARAVPTLRLDPAVHYHLGIGYARMGQNELARLHLENVAHLAQNRKNVPELPLATEALRSMASVR